MKNQGFNFVDINSLAKSSEFLNPFIEEYTEFLFETLKKGVKKLSEGFYDEAESDFNTFLEAYPFSTIPFLLKLLIDTTETEPIQQIIDLKNTLTNNHPDISLLYFVKGCIFFRQFDIDEAKEEFDTVIRLDSEFFLAYYLKATCQAIRGIHSLAVPNYILGLKANTKHNEIKANLAYSYLILKQTNKALRLFKKVAPHFPNNHKIQYNLGLCYFRKKKDKSAIKFFTKAIILQPLEYGYYLTRARSYMRIWQFNKAQKDLEVTIESNNPIAHQLLKLNTKVINKELPRWFAEKEVKKLIRNRKRH